MTVKRKIVNTALIGTWAGLMALSSWQLHRLGVDYSQLEDQKEPHRATLAQLTSEYAAEFIESYDTSTYSTLVKHNRHPLPSIEELQIFQSSEAMHARESLSSLAADQNDVGIGARVAQIAAVAYLIPGSIIGLALGKMGIEQLARRRNSTLKYAQSQ